MAPNRMRVTNCPHAPILFLSQLCQIALHGLCVFTFVALSVSLAANEPFLSKPSNEWTETEALQVLNDSPWANTITTTTQDTPCDYEHAVFPACFAKRWPRYQICVRSNFLRSQSNPMEQNMWFDSCP
jgi:hypothetical protein